MREVRQGARAIDRYLEVYDVRSLHEIEVDASGTATYRAARELDMGRSVPIMALFALRGLPHLLTGKARPTRSMKFETLLDLGFTILEERHPREFVLGAIGRFWRPDSGVVRSDAADFRDFGEPGYAKAAMTFVVEPKGAGSLLATETRVLCTDAAARRKFTWYWRAIGPFSGFIRRLMLEEIKRSAEMS